MGFNRENYRRIKREYETKNLKAKEKARDRANELHVRFPEIRDIDDALEKTGMKILEASLNFSGNKLDECIAGLKQETEDLRNARNACLEFYNIPIDYSDVKYECPECRDSGFVGIKMCRCMKEKLILAGYESSGIGSLILSKTFDNFNPDLQSESKEALDRLNKIYNFCKKYAETFSEKDSKNLIFIGPTGLGKTHLSTAIAGKVISLGVDVVCETAPNLFSDFEYERFNRPYGTAGNEQKKTDRYFECDLLIIDDLGAEMTNQFTVSCLFNLINTRINQGKKMIINTNLTDSELKNRYEDRITSRLFGEFFPLVFVGKDARQIRTRMKKTTKETPE